MKMNQNENQFQPHKYHNGNGEHSNGIRNIVCVTDCRLSKPFELSVNNACHLNWINKTFWQPDVCGSLFGWHWHMPNAEYLCLPRKC